ncbi:hypothetical protein DFH08DRAFT_990672 [Mycena albidolilacea]|uniref:Uncharacterized protein n=1 Tax=Mycena albidolilacea TaxID=1033008 RepID=A0AAD7A8P6_9AGAR|nr:hypothetical protein DFH08DRAFT_990672 [Mycena albidolilacea]
MPGHVSLAATPSRPSTRNGNKRNKLKPPTAYFTSHDLLAALTKSCLEDAQVDFSGSYSVSASSTTDAGAVSDKQRVQTVANDVWKATGYRFTCVCFLLSPFLSACASPLPHPSFSLYPPAPLSVAEANDEASPTAAYKTTLIPPTGTKPASGRAAMQRFACRSRLRITCVPGGGGADSDSDGDGECENRRKGKGRVVTVRMQHCLRHEAYRDSEAAPAPGWASAAQARSSAGVMLAGPSLSPSGWRLPYHVFSAPPDPITLSNTTVGIATEEENPTTETLGAPWPTPVADFLDDLYVRDEAEKAEEENPTTETPGAPWPTPVADFLDALYARDEAAKAEAAEKLRAKEERQAQRRRKSGAQATTSRGKGKDIITDRRRQLCSRGMRDLDGRDDADDTAAPAPETKSATVAAVGDDVDGMPTRLSKRRRLDAVVVPPPESPTGSNSAPPSTLSLHNHRSLSTPITGISSSTIPAPLNACQNCGTTTPSGPKGACALTSTLAPGPERICICHPCSSEYARTHRPPELELQR